MTKAEKLQKLVRSSKRLKPATVVRFFKTGKGTYGEHDKFLGMSMPDIRTIAKENAESTSLTDIQCLLESEYNDERCLGLVMLVEQYQQAKRKEKQQQQPRKRRAGKTECASESEINEDEEEEEEGDFNESTSSKTRIEQPTCQSIYEFYLQNTRYINNWNLVDTSCYFIVGDYLLEKDRQPLYQLAESKNLWERRIAIVSTMAFIRHGEFEDTFAIADKLIQDEEDLIHKAVGWLIREAGKRQLSALTDYLDQKASFMPRTMLRYAIEKLSKEEQKNYLSRK
jgi:3-methyladenine DNA glycosylase AlkD